MKQFLMASLMLSLTTHFFTQQGFSQVRYVNLSAIGANDGTSWDNAFTDLQTALDSAMSDDQIWIASGIYRPGGSTPDVSSVFTIRKNLSIYGGFSGTETYLEERDPKGNPTVLSGDINEDDITADFGNNKSDNTRHVIYVDSLLSPVVIDRVTIEGGNTLDAGNASIYNRSGGGLYAMSPVLLNQCHITSNFGREGGGIYFDNKASASRVMNCIFSYNKTTQRGAGLYAVYANDILISNSTFTDNQTERGAIYPAFCNNVLIENCLFQENHTTAFNGGAIFSFQNTNLVIRKCDFFRNSAVFGGAIVINGDQLPAGTLSGDRIEFCHFQENSASEDAGSIYCLKNPDLLISKCDFVRDSAKSGGGVLIEQQVINQTDTNKIWIDSCLFKDNHARNLGGGALRLIRTSAKIEHCIFEQNSTNGLLDGGGGHVFQNCPGQFIIYRDNSFTNAWSGGFAGAATAYGKEARYLFENCLFNNNRCDRVGGAVHNAFAAVAQYKNCWFEKNSGNSGGALSLAHDSTTIQIKDSYFIRNEAADGGGAIYSSAGSGIIELDNCALDSNKAITGFGGAIYTVEEGNDDISTLTLKNSKFGFNSSIDQAGAVNIVDTDTHISSCVFYENICSGLGIGGALAIKASDQDTMEATIINTTIVDNYGYLADGIAQETGSINGALTTTIQNCIFRNQGLNNYLVESGTPVIISRGGNMSHDESLTEILVHCKDMDQTSPIFNNPADYDFSLSPDSPGIDAGVMDDAPEFDILGNPRVNAPDIGAYENQMPVYVTPVIRYLSSELTINPNQVTQGVVMGKVNNKWRGEMKLWITDIMGRMRFYESVDKSDEEVQFTIPLKNASPGAYTLLVQYNNQLLTSPFIIAE